MNHYNLNLCSYGEQETKLTISVECETEEYTSDETVYTDLETQFNVADDPQQLELTPPTQFLQVPDYQPISEQPVFSSRLANPSATSLISATYTHATTVNKPASRGGLPKRTISRINSVYHEVRNDIRGPSVPATTIAEDHDDTEAVDNGEEQDHCINIYLSRVCERVRTYFRRCKGVKKISAENNVATFTLPKVEVPLSEIFKLMELLKSETQLHIINYSVSQSNLEQVKHLC